MPKSKKKQETRGRKKLPIGEKKIEIRIYVPEKFIELNGGKENIESNFCTLLYNGKLRSVR